MYLDNPTAFQCYKSKDRIIGFFTIARQGKKSVSTITHKPLHDQVDILYEHVTRQPLEPEPYWISRS